MKNNILIKYWMRDVGAEVINTLSDGVALAKNMTNGCQAQNCKTAKRLIFGWPHETDLLNF